MDFKKKTDQDLHKILSEKRTDLRSFRFGLSGSRTKNIKKGKEVKRDIARALTELSTRNK